MIPSRFSKYPREEKANNETRGTSTDREKDRGETRGVDLASNGRTSVFIGRHSIVELFPNSDGSSRRRPSARDRSIHCRSFRRRPRGWIATVVVIAPRHGRPGTASSPGQAGPGHHGHADRHQREDAAAASSSYRVRRRPGRERPDVGERRAARREREDEQRRHQEAAQQLPCPGDRLESPEPPEQPADRGVEVRDGGGQVTPALLRPYLLSHLPAAQGQQASC